MARKVLSAVCCAALLLLGLFAGKPAAQVSAASDFAFQGSMSKEVLRHYASRAVTHAGLCVENVAEDPIFEEDLRMLRRIGAKYIGRAAYYSWGGSLSASNIEKHYELAKEKADLVHQADPEIILQAGIFEIVYRETANNTAIPAYVFEAFGLPPESRNFRYSDIAFPNGHRYGTGMWGNNLSAVPNIASIETQMYFYYQITRYIDAGYEAFHLGQVELMMDGDYANARYWDKVTTLGRAYAKTHARRGVVLFDCHVTQPEAGMKIGDRLVFDLQGACLYPSETSQVDGAMMCRIADYREDATQRIGRSVGGQHPLGFTIENNFTILEFDNFGGNDKPGVATPNGFFSWGFDDVTWFALQPEWYRNQFLLECDQYLRSHDLDSSGKQQYFLQLSCRRVITPGVGYYPELPYTPGDSLSVDFLFDYAQKENSGIEYHGETNTYTLTVKKDYRANRQSDGCPNGFNQEDTIREIFLGKNAPEDPELTRVILPEGYSPDASADDAPANPSATPSKGSTVAPTGGSAGGAASIKGDSTRTTGKNNASAGNATSGALSESGVTDGQTDDGDRTQSGWIDDGTAGSQWTENRPTATVSRPSDVSAGTGKPRNGTLPWIVGGIAAVLLLGGGGCAVWLLRGKKKRSNA